MIELEENSTFVHVGISKENLCMSVVGFQGRIHSYLCWDFEGESIPFLVEKKHLFLVLGLRNDPLFPGGILRENLLMFLGGGSIQVCA